MQTSQQIFFQIASVVRQIIPDAEVSLFGSRANNTATEESDWDVLILLNKKPSKQIRQKIHEALFPISVSINAFINTLIVSKADWNNHPAYYSIHQSIKHNSLTSAR